MPRGLDRWRPGGDHANGEVHFTTLGKERFYEMDQLLKELGNEQDLMTARELSETLAIVEAWIPMSNSKKVRSNPLSLREARCFAALILKPLVKICCWVCGEDSA